MDATHHLRRLAVLVAILLAGASAAAQTTAAQSPRVARVEAWLQAITEHEPGTADDAAALVGSWSTSQIRTLWLDTNVVVTLMRDPRRSAFSIRSPDSRTSQPIAYTGFELRRMKILGCAAGGIVLTHPGCVEIKAGAQLDAPLKRLTSRVAEARARGDEDNFILRRGALLHSDVAMYVPPAMEPVGGANAIGPDRVRIQTSDGLPLDLAKVATHWELARMLLDNVRGAGSDRAAPGRDDMVRLWYRATASWMQNREDHDTDHLDHARVLFPDDADLFFLSACQREAYASPEIQNALRIAVIPASVRIDIGSDRVELRHAETFFRRALAINPAMVEARLRLGRVLSLLERHADAAVELRAAVDATSDQLLRYYGQLFLGGAEEALGKLDAARDAYEAASRLFPGAQSPRIALSALARRRGDRANAWKALEPVFHPPDDSEHEDPWWAYHVAQTRDVDDLLDRLRRPFLDGKEP